MENEVKQHWIAASLLGLGALSMVIVFVVLKTHADPTVTITASTSNIKPSTVIDYVTDSASSTIESTGTALTLTDAASVTVHVKGTFTDPNGCSDIMSGGRVDGVIYHGTPDCTMGEPNSAHCHTMSACSLSSCSGSSGQFDCTAPVWFNSDPTGAGSRFADDTWEAIVMAKDATMVTNNDESGNVADPRTFEIAELTAITLSSADLAFGAMNLDATTSSIALSITNTGNKHGEGVAISGTQMDCSTGFIPAANIKFATTDVAYNSMTSISDSAPVSTGLSIAVNSASSTPMSSSTYFNLKTPASGVAGTCSGTLTFATE